MRIRCVTAAVAAMAFVAGVCAAFPSYGQSVVPAPRHGAIGRPAVNPAFGYHGRRSVGYGAPIDPRAAFAGALIGGFIGALTMPMHYEVPYVTPPEAQWTPPLDRSLQANSVSGAPSIADRWQQFGEPGAVERARSRSPIVDHWQKFFEPSQ